VLISSGFDEVKMEDLHAMDNDQGGVVGHTWKMTINYCSSYVDERWRLDAHRHHRHGDGMECRSVHFIGYYFIDKCKTGFMIDSHTTKKVILVW
jgi:hypothetical protein